MRDCVVSASQRDRPFQSTSSRCRGNRSLSQSQAGIATITMFQLLILVSGVMGMGLARDEHLDRCIQLAQPLLSENHLVVPSTRPELQLVCDKWRVFVECINKYVTSHYTRGQKSKFNGAVESAVRNVYKMCNDNDYSSEYLLHAPCIKQMTMDRDRCGEYYTNMARAVTEGMGTDEEVCCLHRKFRSCMAAQTSCSAARANSDVREFVETFLNNGLHVFDQKCRNYVFSMSHCAGSGRHHRLHSPQLPHSARGSSPARDKQLPAEHRAAAELPSQPALENALEPDIPLAAPQQRSTTPYQGWFRPETTTSVWLASNSLDDMAQAQRQESGSIGITATSILTAIPIVVSFLAR